ncbi:hypothetical protein Tco_0810254 [Tanacetum coccineum]
MLHDTIAAQRRFLAQQRAAEIRSRPPTRTQLRNQMMTYLKHVKSSDENFVAIGSAEDERIIRKLNKKAVGTKKVDSIKEETKEEAGIRKRKLITRKKMKSRKRRFRHGTSEDEKENDELKLCLTIALDEDKEVDYEILDRKYPICRIPINTSYNNHESRSRKERELISRERKKRERVEREYRKVKYYK